MSAPERQRPAPCGTPVGSQITRDESSNTQISPSTATIKLPTPCVMACSLPTGSCQYRCPLQAVAS